MFGESLVAVFQAQDHDFLRCVSIVAEWFLETTTCRKSCFRFKLELSVEVPSEFLDLGPSGSSKNM